MDIVHHPRATTRRAPAEIVDEIPNIDHRFGDGRAEILGIAVCDDHGPPLHTVLAPDSTIVVRISVRAKTNLDRPIVGIIFRDQRGVDFAGSNTDERRLSFAAARWPAKFARWISISTFRRSTRLRSRSRPAVANGTLEHFTICDWIDNAVVLQMSPPEGPHVRPLPLSAAAWK